MLIIVNTDATRPAKQRLIGRIEATLRYRLARFSTRLARVEVRVSGLAVAGRDRGQCCKIEARANGIAPIAVEAEALTFEQALAGAASKALVALDQTIRTLGRPR